MEKLQRLTHHLASQTGVVIVAAGSGSRCHSKRPKQFMDIAGQSVLAHNLHRFRALFPDSPIIVVHHVDHHPYLAAMEQTLAGVALVEGGQTRADSVRAGLAALRCHGPGAVLIHDAARPFVETDICERLLASLEREQAAVPALAVADTLKRGEVGYVTETVERTALYAIQTPQAFKYALIDELHQRAFADGVPALSDDAALCEHYDVRVALVEGSPTLQKITTPSDIEQARRSIHNNDGGQMERSDEIRIGSGFDVHQLIPFSPDTPQGRQVIRLGGVDIPHSHYLKGHSDADVVLHAVTDAVLGALGEGDIGEHFPPSEERYRGADSALFIEDMRQLMQTRSASLVNADITLIGERPKIGPHKPAIRERVAELMGVEPSRINIKATTTEGLGFTGRREGLAVHAVVSLRLVAG